MDVLAERAAIDVEWQVVDLGSDERAPLKRAVERWQLRARSSVARTGVYTTRLPDRSPRSVRDSDERVLRVHMARET